MPRPAAMLEMTRSNLPRPLAELGVEDGDEVSVADPVLGSRDVIITVGYA